MFFSFLWLAGQVHWLCVCQHVQVTWNGPDQHNRVRHTEGAPCLLEGLDLCARRPAHTHFVLPVNCGLVFPTCLLRTQVFLIDLLLQEASSVVSFHCGVYFENSPNSHLSNLHCWPLPSVSGSRNPSSSAQCLLPLCRAWWCRSTHIPVCPHIPPPPFSRTVTWRAPSPPFFVREATTAQITVKILLLHRVTFKKKFLPPESV